MPAVDVFSEPELIELLGDRAELLAVADAIAQTQLRRRRSSSVARVAVVVAAAAATVGLLVVAPWQGGRGPSLSERALAAVGEGPVVHAVIQDKTGAISVDLATGRETPLVRTFEIWFDEQRRIEHTLIRVGGRLTDDTLRTPTGGQTLGGPMAPPASVPTLDPALADFVNGYRAALTGGKARQLGEGSIDGRPVSWLVFTLDDGQSERVAIDKETSKPLWVETSAKDGSSWSYTVRSIEALPEGSGDFTPPHPPTTALPQTFRREPTPIQPEKATTVVPGALAAGKAIDGLALTQVRRAKLTTEYGADSGKMPTVSSGIEFEYGPGTPADGRPYVWLEEAAHPEPVYGWNPWIAHERSNLIISHSPRSPDGLTVKNGIYVTILASNRELMLDAARALQPFSTERP